MDYKKFDKSEKEKQDAKDNFKKEWSQSVHKADLDQFKKEWSDNQKNSSFTGQMGFMEFKKK